MVTVNTICNQIKIQHCRFRQEAEKFHRISYSVTLTENVTDWPIQLHASLPLLLPSHIISFMLPILYGLSGHKIDEYCFLGGKLMNFFLRWDSHQGNIRSDYSYYCLTLFYEAQI